MKKKSAAYAEHVLDIFTEILHETITMRPLRKIGAGVTPSLAHGLQFVFQHGVCSVRDIAQGLSMSYSAASQLTDRLVKKGLATRSENRRDRRLSEIRLTDDGYDLVKRIRLQRVANMSRILSRMEPGCRGAFVENLENFIAAAIDDGESALETCTHCGRDHISECVINELYRAATGEPIKQV
ncbi:MAG TPA: MarR family transcriptional regulator [Armatimonadota bacterium]|nr:MarR family transcriptional regulator [Armatimonadota bacterium]